jgi:hypothetical protein
LQKQIEEDREIREKRIEERNNNKDLPELSKASNKNLEEEIQKLDKEKRMV